MENPIASGLDAIANSLNQAKDVKRQKRHGEPYKNIIKIVFKNGREYHLHATKGWRSYRHSG